MFSENCDTEILNCIPDFIQIQRVPLILLRHSLNSYCSAYYHISRSYVNNPESQIYFHIV